MAIPGTLEYEGPTSVSQERIDELPSIRSVTAWLSTESIVDPEADPIVDSLVAISFEQNWNEEGYESGAIWFLGDETAADTIASDLSTYGFDLYDQGSGKWYVFLPNDRQAS